VGSSLKGAMMSIQTGKKSKAKDHTNRTAINEFEEIINVGPSIADDFRLLGMTRPQQLIGQDPLAMYQQICKLSGHFHDPCVLDVFMASVDYMNGNSPRKCWEFTAERKTTHTDQVDRLREQYPRPSFPAK
jgi:hypothetical protein